MKYELYELYELYDLKIWLRTKCFIETIEFKNLVDA